MTRSSFVFILYLVTLASFVTTIHARWLNDNMHEIKKQKLPQPPPSARDSLFLSSLPKGSTVPYSAPTKKGHSLIVDDEKLIARHLAAIDRILRSVPSPGVGN